MRRMFLPLVVAILLASAILRLYQLDKYPPGPHFDEAANVLITRSIAFGGANLFPIANSFQGRESLYFYLNAPLFQLIHDAPFVMRLSSVFMNLVTIAATIRLGRAMFPGKRGVVIGIIAGVSMTLSFNQILLSRQMFRVISLPMMQALAFLFLWQGLNKQRLLLIAVAGFFVGGSLYTYMSSRLLPFWLGLAAIFLLHIDRKQWRTRLIQGGVFFGVMFIVLIPLIRFAIDNPDIFFQRFDEVTSDDYGKVTLLESIELHLKMFFIRGDFGNVRLNDPGRPYFSVLEGVALLIGLFVALKGILGRGNPNERTAYLIVLLSPLMVIPSVLAVGGLPPSHMRSIAMAPLIFIAVGIGIEATVHNVIQQISKRTFAIGVILILFIGGIIVGRDYFSWAKRVDLFHLANGDLAMAMEWFPSVTDDDTLVYVASLYPEHPTVLIVSDNPPTSLGSDSLILPPPDTDGIAIFPREIPLSPEWQDMLVPYQIEDIPNGPDGQPAFSAFTLSHDIRLPDIDIPDVSIHNAYVTFLGMYSNSVLSGRRASFTMAWQIDQSLPYYNLWPNVFLKDENGFVIASNSIYLLGTDRWRIGEIVLQRAYIDIPVGTPPDTYDLAISWIDRDTNTFLPFAGEQTGIEAQIGHIQVERPDTFSSTDTLTMDIKYEIIAGDGVRLLGWNTLPSAVRPGEKLNTILFWQAVESDDVRNMSMLQVILRNLDGEDTTIWQGNLDYEPSEWVDNELVKSWTEWRIPLEQASGPYTLIMRNDEFEVELIALEVVGLPRIFDLPNMQVETDLSFGGMIRLYGYSLDVTDSNIAIDLAWKSERSIDADYSVFIHLVNNDGETVQQFDTMPLQNTYPMTMWADNEFVVDHYQFENVPQNQDFTLRIGIYLPSNGLRLPLNTDGISDFLEIEVKP